MKRSFGEQPALMSCDSTELLSVMKEIVEVSGRSSKPQYVDQIVVMSWSTWPSFVERKTS